MAKGHENIEPYKMKKGETRNPNGRPKGSKSFKDVIRAILDTKTYDKLEKMELSNQERIAFKLMRKALDNSAKVAGRGYDLKAIEMIMDRIDGKPKQSIDQTINGETINKIEIEFIETKSENP